MKIALNELRRAVRKVLTEQSSCVIRACRSGYNFDFRPSHRGSLGSGFYFTTNEKRARKYSGMDRCIVWVDLRLTNPLVGVKTELAAQLGLGEHQDESGAYDFMIGKQLGDLARKQGYDGIIAHESNGLFDEIVVFEQHSIVPIGEPDCAIE